MEQWTTQRIYAFDICREFVGGFYGDPIFSDPMLTNEEQIQNNLIKAIERTESHCVLGVFQGQQLLGVFAFLVLRDEQYIEMLVGLSRDKATYGAVFAYLRRNYAGYGADFVFNPGNYILREMLEREGAGFETEQQKMLLTKPETDMDTTGVEMYSEKYARQYFQIHSKDIYWTGEKVVAAPDRFRTFLAIYNGAVVGYLDVTHCFDENEPFDLFVVKDHRRKGFGRKLLAKALEMNKPNGMMLLVAVDNEAAIRLYESMGFQKADGQNSLTAHWKIPLADPDHRQEGENHTNF